MKRLFQCMSGYMGRELVLLKFLWCGALLLFFMIASDLPEVIPHGPGRRPWRIPVWVGSGLALCPGVPGTGALRGYFLVGGLGIAAWHFSQRIFGKN